MRPESKYKSASWKDCIEKKKKNVSEIERHQTEREGHVVKDVRKHCKENGKQLKNFKKGLT